MHARFLIVPLLPLLCAGCGGKTLIVVHNPKTGETAQCQDDARLFGSAGRVEDCAQAYEKLGWERVR